LKIITFVAWCGIADLLKAIVGVEGDASSACSVGTNSSAHTVGWLSDLRDTPTVGIEDEQMAAEVRT
jgi:hypothetical protein